MNDVSEEELTVEVIKKNPWNAVRLGVSEATPEAVLLYASDTILVLTTELLSHRAEAVEHNDLAAARALHEHYLEAETRADMLQVLLNRVD